MPASFDTMGINLTGCVGSYDPGQYAELDFLKGAYTSNCGVDGSVRGTWDLRGYQILVDPTSGLVTTEAGGTATFEIVPEQAADRGRHGPALVERHRPRARCRRRA